MGEDTTISERIGYLIGALESVRTTEGRSEAARELSLAITHLEDAQMRVNRAGTLMTGAVITPGRML